MATCPFSCCRHTDVDPHAVRLAADTPTLGMGKSMIDSGQGPGESGKAERVPESTPRKRPAQSQPQKKEKDKEREPKSRWYEGYRPGYFC